MSASNFLNGLLNFPKDTINAETVELLDVYLTMPDYNLASAKSVCGDVAGLCSWTKVGDQIMMKFHIIPYLFIFLVMLFIFLIVQKKGKANFGACSFSGHVFLLRHQPRSAAAEGQLGDL